jgi:hypothetical protein
MVRNDVVKRNRSAAPHEPAVHEKVSLNSFVAVISVNEEEIEPVTQ